MDQPMLEVSEVSQECVGSQGAEFTRHAVRGDRQRAPCVLRSSCCSLVPELASDLACEPSLVLNGRLAGASR